MDNDSHGFTSISEADKTISIVSESRDLHALVSVLIFYIPEPPGVWSQYWPQKLWLSSLSLIIEPI